MDKTPEEIEAEAQEQARKEQESQSSANSSADSSTSSESASPESKDTSSASPKLNPDQPETLSPSKPGKVEHELRLFVLWLAQRKSKLGVYGGGNGNDALVSLAEGFLATRGFKDVTLAATMSDQDRCDLKAQPDMGTGWQD